jgi:hypothetical protein
MRRFSSVAAALALGCTLAIAAPVAAEAATKKPSYAECMSLLDPFRGKTNDAVKDQAVSDYAPLVSAYWQKGCSPGLYQEQIADPALRKRIEAVAPPPKKKAT